jgi:hypothetical protein
MVHYENFAIQIQLYNIYNISVMKTKMYINIGSRLYLEIIKILNFASKENKRSKVIFVKLFKIH